MKNHRWQEIPPKKIHGITYSDNYVQFLEELISTAIDGGDLYFVTSAWCQVYCRITRQSYKHVIKKAFANYTKGESL